MNTLKHVLLVIGFLLAATGATAQAIKVACIGDSITEGAGVNNPALNAYPVVLGRLLGTNYQTRNFGASGRTLLKRGDYPYWNEAAFRNATNYAPDIVTILLGTNDSKPQNWRYKDQFAPDLRAMVDIFANLPSHPRIFICQPVPAYGVGFEINPDVIKHEIIPIIKQVAREKNVATVNEDEAAVLARHGHPLKVASGYQTRRYLIGPDLYPAFRQTLSTLLVAVLAVQLVIALAVSVGTGWTLSVGGLVSQAVSTVVWVVAIVTLVFVGIEGAGTRLKWYERWEPRSIARGSVSLVNRGDVVTNLITEAIFLLWWNDALSLRGWVPGGTEASAPLVAAFSDAWTPPSPCNERDRRNEHERHDGCRTAGEPSGRAPRGAADAGPRGAGSGAAAAGTGDDPAR